MLLYIFQRGGRERLHQRQSPPFPHTLLSAYLCHDDITIPSYSIIHIVSPHKLYLHDKSLPRAHPPPHTTSNHPWNTATLLFISLFDNYISKQKEVQRGAKRCKEVRGGAPGGARRCAISCTTPRALSVLRQYHYVALELNMDFILSNKADCVAKLASD